MRQLRSLSQGRQSRRRSVGDDLCKQAIADRQINPGDDKKHQTATHGQAVNAECEQVCGAALKRSEQVADARNFTINAFQRHHMQSDQQAREQKQPTKMKHQPNGQPQSLQDDDCNLKNDP